MNFLQSGAKINISDGSCPERIVTVTGHTDSIYKAFKLICNKFEEVCTTYYAAFIDDQERTRLLTNFFGMGSAIK